MGTQIGTLTGTTELFLVVCCFTSFTSSFFAHAFLLFRCQAFIKGFPYGCTFNHLHAFTVKLPNCLHFLRALPHMPETLDFFPGRIIENI